MTNNNITNNNERRPRYGLIALAVFLVVGIIACGAIFALLARTPGNIVSNITNPVQVPQEFSGDPTAVAVFNEFAAQEAQPQAQAADYNPFRDVPTTLKGVHCPQGADPFNCEEGDIWTRFAEFPNHLIKSGDRFEMKAADANNPAYGPWALLFAFRESINLLPGMLTVPNSLRMVYANNSGSASTVEFVVARDTFADAATSNAAFDMLAGGSDKTVGMFVGADNAKVRIQRVNSDGSVTPIYAGVVSGGYCSDCVKGTTGGANVSEWGKAPISMASSTNAPVTSDLIVVPLSRETNVSYEIRIENVSGVTEVWFGSWNVDASLAPQQTTIDNVNAQVAPENATQVESLVSGLRIRSIGTDGSCGMNGKVLANMASGDTLPFVSTSNGWHVVTYGNVNACVSANAGYSKLR